MGATVELLNTLPDVVLSGNQVPLRLQASDNLIETAGVKSEISLTWTAVAVADEYFDLLLAGETVRFTCKAAPDNSGSQFHDNSLSGTLEEWVALLAQDLQSNYLLSRYYDLVIDGAEITITAKENGSLYSQEFTAGAGIDVTAVETGKDGIDEVRRAFYSIVVLLYCNSELVTELLLNVDADGIAETDVSKLLAAYVSSDFSWPESDSVFAIARTGNLKSWYFRYGEKWGDSSYRALQRSDDYYILLGGLSWMQQAKYNAEDSDFWAHLEYNQYFLSWAPVTRYIGPAEPVKLFFCNHSAATSLILRAKLYTASSDSTITIDTATGVTDKAIYEFVLSPDKAALTGLDDQTLVKFEAWIENESNVRISEIRTFIIDYNYYEHTRYFIFRNSLGAFEVLRTTGLLTKVDEYERESSLLQVASDYTSRDREDVSISNIERQKFRLAMGWLSRYAASDEYRNWLRDFCLSKEVYQAIGNTLKPVRITADNLDHGKDRDTVKEFTFDFENAFTSEHFTKEIFWNLFDESFSSDFEMAQ